MIRITLQITDPKTAEAYRGKPEIIAADLLHCSLMTACEVVSVEEGEEPARNPWRPISELGEIAYMEDGSRRWNLFEGHNHLRLFEIQRDDDSIELHIGYIDGHGAIRTEWGDYTIESWCDATRFMELDDLARIGRDDSMELRKWISEAAPMLSRACEIVVEDSPQRLGEIAGFRGVLEECPVEAEDWKDAKP